MKVGSNFDISFFTIKLTTISYLGIRSVLALINTTSTDSKPSGVMIPIPQYPLYSATIAEYGMYPIDYYLDEGKSCLFILILAL